MRLTAPPQATGTGNCPGSQGAPAAPDRGRPRSARNARRNSLVVVNPIFTILCQSGLRL